MKRYTALLLLMAAAASCKMEPIGQQPMESIPPAPVTNVKAESIPGGAIITYTLPADEDLLYIKGVYSLKDGVPSEVRTSLYNDTLKVVGFGDTNPHDVTIYAVDRNRNESQPVKITVTPLEPSVITIGKTVDLYADFGGVTATWQNVNRAEVSIWVLREDENKEFVPLDTFYSSLAEDKGSVRGLDTLDFKFGVFVQDRWENRSPTKYYTLKPLFETKYDRLKFKEVKLPGDQPSAYGWVMPNMWNETIGDEGFHTPQGSGVWPHFFTFDLGVMGKISRIVYYQRQGSWIYAHGNPRKVEIWGAQTLDPSGSWDSWRKMAEYTSIKPSGFPVGINSPEDKAKAAAGDEIVISPFEPKARYIRIKVTESWSGGDFVHISEIRVYGDNREKNN